MSVSQIYLTALTSLEDELCINRGDLASAAGVALMLVADVHVITWLVISRCPFDLVAYRLQTRS